MVRTRARVRVRGEVRNMGWRALIGGKGFFEMTHN
jgi:hypothetical protein